MKAKITDVFRFVIASLFCFAMSASTAYFFYDWHRNFGEWQSFQIAFSVIFFVCGVFILFLLILA